MTEHDSTKSGRVVIVGGGVAGLEALLALRALGSDRLAITLVSPDDSFVDRPMTVAEPFGFGAAARLSLPAIATFAHAAFIRGTAAAVDGESKRVTLADGQELAYDALVLALGATMTPPFSGAVTFGLEGSVQGMRDMLAGLRRGEGHSASFVAPAMTGWLLPLYELSLMTARELAQHNVQGVKLRLLSPEVRPLSLFGSSLSQGVGRLLDKAGIEFIHASFAKANGGGLTYAALGQPSSDYVVTLPLLSGPGLPGIPASEPHGFIPVDEYCRVTGMSDVYAAGDGVDFSVKQGGLAAQQADTLAAHIAAAYGADVEVEPFAPALRGMLFTGDEPLYMRSGVPGADADVPGAWYPLWWPPTKVAGRHLAPYLFERAEEDDELGGPPVGFIDVDIPLSEITLPG